MNYDSDQTQIIETGEPLNLVLAGAGSGKTATLIGRVKYLLDSYSGIHSQEIVIITFTNQAADEITRRLATLFGQTHTSTTIKSQMLLGFCGTLHGFCLRLIREHGHIVGLDGRALSVLDAEAQEEMVKEVIKSTNYKGTRTDLDAEIKKGPLFDKMTRRMDKVQITAVAFYNAMRTAGVVDYDSILFYGLAIVKQLQTSPFKALFVDEFQDSGNLDFQIYKALPIAQKFYVGDPDQAIYSFRGGKLQNILDLAKNQSVNVRRLENNYRCDQTICDAANKLILANQKRLQKRCISRTGNLGSVTIWRNIKSAVEEVSKIADDITVHNCQNDCAVLVRTNPLVRFVADQLQAKGLLVNRRELANLPVDWKRARALVSFLANPYSDRLAYNVVYAVSGPVIAEKNKHEAQIKMRSMNDLFFQIPFPLSLLELPLFLHKYQLGPDSTARIMAAYNVLPIGATPADLDLALSREPMRETDGTGVVVSTMHSAKGREWQAVYLAAFEQGLVPMERPDTDIEEERRLAYVAITRAKRRLVISFAAERNTPFDFTPKPATPSQFIAEAGL